MNIYRRIYDRHTVAPYSILRMHMYPNTTLDLDKISKEVASFLNAYAANIFQRSESI